MYLPIRAHGLDQTKRQIVGALTEVLGGDGDGGRTLLRLANLVGRCDSESVGGSPLKSGDEGSACS